MADPSRPLRIGIACYPLIGGSGILATALGQDLARRGHEVHFFSYARPVRLDLAAPRIHFHAVEVSEYALFRYPDYTLPLAVRMAEVARERGLDVFHVHYAVPHATAACMAAEMLGAGAPQIVTTLHGTDTNLLGQDPSYRPAIEHALAQSDAVTVVSESLRRETEATFRLTRPAEVIPNFFDPTPPARTREAARRALAVEPGEFLVAHLSNLRPGKRIDLLLRAFAAVPAERRARLLVLAGAPFAPWESLVDELGLRGRVTVRENGADVADFLHAADAGLYTSDNESFGLSILETLFYARPVVAFRVGGIPEVVREGATGFLHPFGDTAALARSLARLAAEPDLARAMGERGRRDVTARFTADEIVPRYEAVYRRALATADAEPDWMV